MRTVLPILAASFQSAIGQDAIRTCIEHPTGLPTYNPDWYYHEFVIPKDAVILSTYGGFTRTSWYSEAEHDYIAQYYRIGQPPTNLDEYQLWNYDNIHVSMYNREWDISGLNLQGGGIMRISAPLTHFVTWNEACVSYAPSASDEAVPEPASVALFALSLPLLALTVRQRKSQAVNGDQ